MDNILEKLELINQSQKYKTELQGYIQNNFLEYYNKYCGGHYITLNAVTETAISFCINVVDGISFYHAQVYIMPLDILKDKEKMKKAAEILQKKINTEKEEQNAIYQDLNEKAKKCGYTLIRNFDEYKPPITLTDKD